MKDKDLCTVCEMSWHSHGLGGNCTATPIWRRRGVNHEFESQQAPRQSASRHRGEPQAPPPPRKDEADRINWRPRTKIVKDKPRP